MTGLCRLHTWKRLALVLTPGAMLLAFTACAPVPSGAKAPTASVPQYILTASSRPLPAPTASPSALSATSTPPPIPVSTLIPATVTVPAPFHADVVLMPGRTTGVTQVHVGQIVQVRVATALGWRITFNPVYLVSLLPDSRLADPGPDGWFLRAARAGESEIMLTGTAPPCTGGAPCPPPNVPRLSFVVQILG